MNKRIQELGKKAAGHPDMFGLYHFGMEELERFAELIVRECAEELRDAEREADRAYKATETKERLVFDGYDFATLLEDRFGVEE